MGRSFLSIRQGVNILAGRWTRIARRLKRKSGAGGMLVVMAKQHSSACFAGCNDPLEAAVFSAFVGLVREQGLAGREPHDRVDP